VPSSVPVMQSPPGAETIIDGQRYLYFAGTGYLGLAGHPEVIEAACEATRRYGIHSATSRGGFGHIPLTLEVERRAAEFFGVDDAFYFITGYVANHILVQALAGRVDALFVDAAAHFCIEEAARLAGRPIARFRHRDPEDLAQALQSKLKPGQRPMVLSDGVFSLTGALAPLHDYLRVLSTCELASLVIDDAHGWGVLGERGRGTLEHLGLWSDAINATVESSGVGLYVGGTLAKALGGFGGLIPGSRPFVDRVRSASHYYEGASAPPSAVAGASAKALELVRRDPALRQRLQANIRQLRSGLRHLGVPTDDSPAANLGVQIGDAANMQRIHATLKAKGILVPYVAAYAGSTKAGLLRFAVCATHTPAMIAQLLDELQRTL
jgi:8-amino-7-oxononanoate synthase